MSNSPVEQNPVFLDQKLRAKKALCAAFATAAVSTAIVGVLANDNAEKQKITALATLWVAMAASPMMRRKKLESEIVPIRTMSQPYGIHHPYQIEADRITDAMNIKPVTVYKSSHPKMAVMSVIADWKDIFVGDDFDDVLKNEKQMKAIIGHELGHFKEVQYQRSISDIFRNVSAVNVWLGAGFVLSAPIAPPLALAAMSGCFALHLITVQMHLYGARRKEHMADLYSLSHVQDKEDLSEALKAIIPAAEQSLLNHVERNNEISKKEGKPQYKVRAGAGLNYNSLWTTHPNVPERLYVIDEAMKKGPV